MHMSFSRVPSSCFLVRFATHVGSKILTKETMRESLDSDVASTLLNHYLPHCPFLLSLTLTPKKKKCIISPAFGSSIAFFLSKGSWNVLIATRAWSTFTCNIAQIIRRILRGATYHLPCVWCGWLLPLISIDWSFDHILALKCV